MNAAWLKEYVEHYGPLPENYLVIDTETTGVDRNNDLIIELAYGLCISGGIAVTPLLLDWTKDHYIDQEWFIKRMGDTHKFMVETKGAEDFLTYDRLVRYGQDPIEVLNHLWAVFEYLETYSLPLIGHNCCRFDIPMIERHFKTFLGKEFDVARRIKVIDTGAMVKGTQLNSSPKQLEFTSFEYLNRVAKAYSPNIPWSLDRYCLSAYNLDDDLGYLGISKKNLHSAGTDCIVTYCLFSKFKKLLAHG